MADDFRKLNIWNDAKDLAIRVYKISSDFPKDELFSLTNQLRRSSASVPANVAESCGRFGVKDKVQLLMIARGSLYETRSHLSIANGLSYINSVIFDKIDGEYESLAKRLNAFINYTKELAAK